ncbi:MAG TPA: hypothetical protein VIJ33_01615 [Solirubrobacteraceae bacterium]
MRITTITIAVGVASVLAACEGQTLDLGGNASSDSDTMAVVTCAGGAADTAATLGSGYSAMTPAECSAPRGSVHPVTSPADVTTVLTGTWHACEGPLFGIDFGVSVTGVEFSSDGNYYGLTEADDDNLERSDSIPAVSGSSSGAGSGSSSGTPDDTASGPDGTFEVIDGSAVYGPGTYELQLRPATGGLFQGQVLITDSPLQVHYLPTNASEQVLAPPVPWSPRKGVCSCVNTSGTVVDRTDPAGLASDLTGRWLMCSGFGAGLGQTALGIEFAADGTWYALDEDTNGNLTRGSGSLDHGTFQIVPTSSLGCSSSSSAACGPEPLSLVLQAQTQGSDNQVVITENPRVLFFGAGTMTPNGPPGVTPAVVNNYVTMFPME